MRISRPKAMQMYKLEEVFQGFFDDAPVMVEPWIKNLDQVSRALLIRYCCRLAAFGSLAPFYSRRRRHTDRDDDGQVVERKQGTGTDHKLRVMSVTVLFLDC